MRKKYPIKPTPKQLKIIKLYWRIFQQEQNIFWAKVGELERKLSKAAKIKDLEFFMCDNDWCGIGQYDRKMRLIQRWELEK